VILYGSRLSPFVEKVARALALKNLDYELVTPRSPLDLRRWNPQTGKMPVLEIDGERVYDSTFILQRLDELAPAPALLAEDPGSAAGQRLLEDWADEALYWSVMALRWSKRNRSASAEQIVSSLPAPAPLRPLVRAFITRQLGGSARAQGLGRLPEHVLVRELGARLEDLLALLGTRPFFFAERPSAADLAVYGMLRMAASGPTPEAGRLLSERPALLDWMKRVEQATGG
jgi:glutathione S-transferase